MSRTRGENYVVEPSDRVAFVGRTGSGKSYLARSLLRGVNRLVVFDPKGTLGGANWGLTTWEDGGSDALAEDRFRVRVRTPLDGNWDPYLDAVMESENVTLYIDEVYGVVQGRNPTDSLRAVITRGRELGIGVWSATQRPKDIPLVIVSESDWFFMFQLRVEGDRKRMAEFMAPIDGGGGYEYGVDEIHLREHNVIAFNDSWDYSRLYRSINVTPMSNASVYARGFQE